MAFFKSRPDSNLPNLTQFYQLTLPAEWQPETLAIEPGSMSRAMLEQLAEIERIREGPDRNATSPLFNSELDRWVLRRVLQGDVKFSDFNVEPDWDNIHTFTYYSEAFPKGYRGYAASVLEGLATLHLDLKNAMIFLCSNDFHQGKAVSPVVRQMLQPREGFKVLDVYDVVNIALENINRRLRKTVMAGGLAFDKDRNEIVALKGPTGLIESRLLTDFYHAAVKKQGDVGGFDGCGECLSVYVKTSAKSVYCSHRCSDRASKRTLRKSLKINSDENKSFSSDLIDRN